MAAQPSSTTALRIDGGQPRWKRGEVEAWAEAVRNGEGKVGRQRKRA